MNLVLAPSASPSCYAVHSAGSISELRYRECSQESLSLPSGNGPATMQGRCRSVLVKAAGVLGRTPAREQASAGLSEALAECS